MPGYFPVHVYFASHTRHLTPQQSTNNVVKDIVELTEGHIDLLINAAGSRGNPVLKVWDLKGNELEDEVRVTFPWLGFAHSQS